MIDLDTARELVKARRFVVTTWVQDTYAEGYDDALCWAWEALDSLIKHQHEKDDDRVQTCDCILVNLSRCPDHPIKNDGEPADGS